MAAPANRRPLVAGVGDWFSAFLAASLRYKSPAATAAASPAADHLLRRLSLLDLILLGIGASIGAGIFVVTGTVARDTGPGVTVSFAVAGAACVLNALCYAELASRFPAVVGGAYMYAYAAFNEVTAFLVFTQLMVDYHIGAASIVRSLAGYLVAVLELFPFIAGRVPSWIGHGMDIGGVFSVNLLAPLLLVLLTVILCRGVGESSVVNSFMTVTKMVIVIFVILVGAFEVNVANWSPFAPNGVKAIVSGATVVFFAYVGFDAVANSAEESKRPQRDLPIGILGSLFVCAALYIAVCLVITGMVPYSLLGEDAPLAEAFNSKGLKFVSILISVGAIAGLTTTLLVGLYVQSRLYLGLARDGLIPSFFAQVDHTRHTPINSQIWVGVVAGIMAGLFNVHDLSHILSVGTLTGYSVVSASVISLRLEDRAINQASKRGLSSWHEGVLCLLTLSICGFVAGLCYRFGLSYIFSLVAVVLALIAYSALQFRHNFSSSPGFSCPVVPLIPAVSIFSNIFLFAQLHQEAWIRFIVLSIVAIAIYAFYGQYHSGSSLNQAVIYHQTLSEDPS